VVIDYTRGPIDGHPPIRAGSQRSLAWHAADPLSRWRESDIREW
jgi:hypothetical protein